MHSTNRKKYIVDLGECSRFIGYPALTCVLYFVIYLGLLYLYCGLCICIGVSVYLYSVDTCIYIGIAIICNSVFNTCTCILLVALLYYSAWPTLRGR